MNKVLLEDVCYILDNKRVPITECDRKKGPYPYYGANGVQDYVDDYIFDDELVLLAEDGGNFGSKEKPIAYRVSGKCWVNNHAHVLKPKENINVNYLCYSLMFYDVSGFVNGATRQKLTQSNMRQMLIPFCSLAEQQRIADELDKVSELIEKRQKQLEKLDLLIKSRFVEMFGDYDLHRISSDMTELSELGTIVGGSTPDTNEVSFWGGENLWITPAEISNEDFVINDTIRKITDEGANSCSLRLLPKNTVLLSSRAPIGKVAIVGKDMYCNQGFKNIICGPKLHCIYLYYLLKYNTEYLNSLGRGATFKEISKSIVEKIKVRVPEITQQNQFADFVEKVEQNKLKIKNSLDKLITLKKALMQKYFG